MKTKIMLAVNLIIIAAVFIMNYIYQSTGFGLKLKGVCSGGFVLLGVINLGYALITKQKNMSFYIAIMLGLVLAFLGDMLIGYSFVIGAGSFALGHILFVAAYCLIRKLNALDLILSGVLFIGAFLFLMFFPLLKFDVPAFRIVCIVYALIISFMLGKAIGNFVTEQSLMTGTIMIASVLFFFSDLMLVLDWFIGLWDWTPHACMGTYYPALCFLALSMFLNTIKSIKP